MVSFSVLQFHVLWLAALRHPVLVKASQQPVSSLTPSQVQGQQKIRDCSFLELVLVGSDELDLSHRWEQITVARLCLTGQSRAVWSIFEGWEGKESTETHELRVREGGSPRSNGVSWLGEE